MLVARGNCPVCSVGLRVKHKTTGPRYMYIEG